MSCSITSMAVSISHSRAFVWVQSTHSACLVHCVHHHDPDMQHYWSFERDLLHSAYQVSYRNRSAHVRRSSSKYFIHPSIPCKQGLSITQNEQEVKKK